MTSPGALLATGRTSVVLAFGTGSVVKVPRPGVPPHWARVEAEITESVRHAGLPCPEVRGLVDVEDRESIIFERIDGPSLWELVLRQPDEVARWSSVLSHVQQSIRQAGALAGLPKMEHRLVSKVLAADGLSDAERTEVSRTASALAEGTDLCHGDLHPANVLMSDAGPIVIDWFDAAIGAAEADVVRTSLLIRPPSRQRAVPAHLPAADPGVLAELHRCYVAEAVSSLCPGEVTDEEVSTPARSGSLPIGLAERLLAWERVLAASRLAEHTTADRADLLALLRRGQVDQESALSEALRASSMAEEA